MRYILEVAYGSGYQVQGPVRFYVDLGGAVQLFLASGQARILFD